jgi:hypothetical protein
MARFRVGVQLHPQHCTIEDLRNGWTAADELGVDTIWTAAQGSSGQTVILGERNSARRTTVFDGTALWPQAEADHYGDPTVAIRAVSPDRTGLGVQGGLVTDGLTVNLGASSTS